MADKGYVQGRLRGIADKTTRQILHDVLGYMLDNGRLGVPAHQTRAENMQLYWLQSTTASDTGEFSIVHGLATTPAYALPVLELDRAGAKLPQLEVSRAADSRRIYLKASAGSTNAAFILLIE